MLNNENIRRVLILRPDHLGDLILFSGALKHIKKRWPKAHIAICVRKYGLELLEYCPYIDELIPYERLQSDFWGQGRIDWLPKFPFSYRLGNILRKNFPALARRKNGIDIPTLPRSDIAILPILAPRREYHQYMRQIPANQKIGICGNHTNQTLEEDKASRNLYSLQMDASALPWDFKEVHATSLFLTFLGIDVPVEELWPELWTKKEDQKKADESIIKKPGQTVLGIAPGVSSMEGKNLPSQWFADVLGLLDSADLQVVLLGSPADQKACNGVAKAIQNSSKTSSVLNMAGKTNAREMIECLKACDLILSQETAALHAAVAIRKPVVGIVGGGHYGRFYPWGDTKLSKPVNKPMDCYGCNWLCKYETIRCIQEIPPADVAHQLNQLSSKIIETKRSLATNQCES